MLSDWRDFDQVAFDAVERGLSEDAAAADSATAALGDAAGRGALAVAVARSGMVFCGWMLVERVFERLGGDVAAERMIPEGVRVAPGSVLGSLAGPAGILLRGERVALNLLNRLSGIATMTRMFVDEVAGTGVEILDTRKTTPGFRALERYAVRCGGGVNHRFDLGEMAMFKDNHWIAAGGIDSMHEAVLRARASGVPVEIEIDRPEQFDAVREMLPDRILLDNMTPETVAGLVRRAGDSRIYLEASGGIGPGNVRRMAETRVDGISIGSLTHSAPSADISFDWEAQ